MQSEEVGVGTRLCPIYVTCTFFAVMSKFTVFEAVIGLVSRLARTGPSSVPDRSVNRPGFEATLWPDMVMITRVH